MSSLDSDPTYIEALDYLRNRQQEDLNAVGVGPSSYPDTTELTLQHLHEISRYESTDDPDRVRRGGFSYYRPLEDKRIQLAENLVRRVAPGPYEDPNYLALLGYQAASLELVLSELIG